MLSSRLVAGLLAVALIAALPHGVDPLPISSAAESNRDANSSLAKLYEKVPEARTLSGKAVAMLVFPSIVKAGFLFGAQYGEGVLREKGKNVGYYNTVAASYGLQAGVQSFGYVLLFMTDSALNYLQKSEGFEIGVGPSIVIVDAGRPKPPTTSPPQTTTTAY